MKLGRSGPHSPTASPTPTRPGYVQSYIASSFHLPVREVPRVLFHGAILSCIIAAFWLMDALKDPVLAQTIGIEYQPVAKLFSVVATLVVVCCYDFLTSLVTKPTLFHIISSAFGFIMLLLSVLLADDMGEGIFSRKAIGWTCYFAIEVYGSLMTTLFWSFTNCTMDLNEAKGSFGLIITTAQLGAIFGSTLATQVNTIGLSGLFVLASILIFGVSGLIQAYHHTYNALLLVSPTSLDALDHPVPHIKLDKMGVGMISRANPLSGCFEGLALITRYSYILKILGVACLYEIVMTIMDYEFKIMAAIQAQGDPKEDDHGSGHGHVHGHRYGMDRQAEDRFASTLGRFGQLSNCVSLALSLFAFSFVVRRFGVDKSLLIFPIALLVAVVCVNLSPSLTVYFVCVSVLKGMICSLNDPVKELLYMPTSEAVKFKAKAWIDVCGSRVAKAIGSLITFVSRGDLEFLRSIGQVPCFALCVAIICISLSAGSQFNELVASGTCVGEHAQTPRVDGESGWGDGKETQRSECEEDESTCSDLESLLDTPREKRSPSPATCPKP